MHIGHYISGAGHIGLIGWLFFGNVFAAEPLEMEFTEVTMVTGAEWAALVLPDTPPDATAVTETPEPPAPEPEPEPQPPAPEPEPTPPPQPEPAPAPEPEPQPDVSDVAAPLPDTDVVEDAPDQPAQPEVAVIVPETAPLESIRPKPRPAPRVAPTPVAQPDTDVAAAPVPQEQTTPDETTETPAPDEDAAQPEAATTEIVTEAEEPASAAPTQSVRPRTRPERVAAAEPEPETPAAPATDTSAVEDVVADLLKEAVSNTSEPSGPPLSRGEQEAFRIAVQDCWNVDVGSQAANVVVTVGFQLSQTGQVEGDVRLVAASGGNDAAVQTAFQSARRAVLRCQRGGYALPVDKYDQWRDVEMTFNPEAMRVR